jgi:tetratricopeptide (TPR) repeat protein
MEDPKAVSSQIAIKDNNVDLMISRIFNASEVPPDLIETVRQYQQRLISKGISQSVDLKTATVNECKIYIGNISTPLDLNSLSEQELLKELQLQSSSSVAETGETAQTQSGKLNWHFAGINQFQSVTICIQDKTWQVEFSRLQSPIHNGSGYLGDQKEIKTKAHKEIYNSLCTALKPLTKEEIRDKLMGNIVVLQGGSGLGKTHCAQHYFYHQAAKKHQMVAWLSGKSQESFLQGWRELAQQLKNIQTSQSKINDDEVIKEWCENQLGQWLLIIDEVNIDAAWLNAKLPKRGGHVLITTHQPHYGIELGQVKLEPLNLAPIAQSLEQNPNSIPQTQINPQSSVQLKPQRKLITIPFIPLSTEDSKELLQAYVGNYWQATGYPKEQKAIEYLIEALGGYPSALTQMALLVHKKCISFERLVEQFKQPILRNYLLTDTVFDQLKDQTFMLSVEKGKEQLLDYFNKHYSLITAEQHEMHLKQFVEILQQEMTKQIKEGKELKEEIKKQENEKVEKIENQEIKLKEEEMKIKKEKFNESEISIIRKIDNDIVQSYWQSVEASCNNVNFNIEELISWLHCLPIYYDKANNQWQISQVGLTALLFQNNHNSMPNAQYLQITPIAKEAVEAKLAEVANTPKLPQEIDISMRLEDASLKNAEIDILTIGKPSEFKVWQLPTVNPYFIPRPKLTDELKAKLPQKKAGEESARLLLTAATGMGGIGKTELARHFVTNKELSDHYQRRFWLTATTASQLRNEFMQLAVYLGLVEAKKYIEDKELIHLIHRWLSINPGWLMVLDNADDYNDIINWIPKEGGAVLITTREPTPGSMNSKQIVQVPLLEPEEALIWLYQLSKRNKDNLSEQERLAAKQLVDDLGYLPLAIAQAAAYLREQTQVSIAEYQTRFTTLLSDPTLASQDESKSDNTQNDPDIKSRKVVASTWMLSLQAIKTYTKSKNVPNIAKELLLACAYYSPKNIPLMLLEKFVIDFNKCELSFFSYMLDEYIGHLLRYSLVERDSKKNVMSVHRLIQQVIRDKITRENKNAEYLLKATNVLNEAYPYGKDQMSDYALKKLLSSHMEEISKYLEQHSVLPNDEINKQKIKRIQQNLFLTLIIKLADAKDDMGDYIKNKELLERALKIMHNQNGDEGNNVVSIYVNLANAYGDLGDYNNKKTILEKALNILEANKVTDSVLIANTLVNLSNAYGALGDARKQRVICESALKMIDNQNNNKHKDTDIAIILVNLSNAYGALGDAHNQKVLLERAFKIQEIHYDKNHILIAKTLVNLANAYGALGDAQQQKSLLEKALKIEEEYFGKEHIQLGITLTNLGNAYGDLGDYNRKRELLELALHIKETHYGKNHVGVAITLVNLANAYGALGYSRKQKTLLKCAYRIIEAYYGNDNIDVVLTLVNLATVYVTLGKFEKQKEHLERAKKVIENCHGKKHINVAKTLINLANVYCALGNPFEQKKLLEQALKIEESYYGKHHIEIVKILNNLSIAYSKLGDYVKQKELLERALYLSEKQYGNEHIDVAKILVNLAAAYSDLGDWQKQKAFLEQALKIQEAYYGKEHIDISITLMNLGSVHGYLGNYELKKRLTKRALKIQEEYYGKEHILLAGTLNNLGNVYGDLKKYNKQKTLQEKALKIQESYYGKEHADIAITLTNLGCAYGDLKDYNKKKIFLERALKIDEMHYGNDHIEVTKSLTNLASAYGALGDPIKKKALLERALKIQEKYYGKDHPIVAQTLFNIGVAFYQEKNLMECRYYVGSAYNIFLNSSNCGVNHPFTQKAKQLLDEINQKILILKKEEHHSGSLYKGIFSKHTTISPNNQLENYIKKYNLPDSSKSSLEKGLRMAATNNQVEGLEIFIKASVNIDAQDNNVQSKKTALHWAVIKKSLPCIKKLLETCAQDNIKDASSKTAYDYAKEINDSTILNLFLSFQNKLLPAKHI